MGNYGDSRGLGVSTCEVHVLGQFSLGFFLQSRRSHNLLTQRDIFEVKCVVIDL